MPVLDLLDVVPTTLDDDSLLAAASSLAEVRRLIDAKQAEVAAELAHRSRREHGTLGLAQRLGAITPDRLLERVAGVEAREAKALIRVGELLTADADAWLAPVGAAVGSGDLSIAKADAIRAGLGAPTPDVAADDLTDAAAALARLAPDLTVDRVAAAARAARHELDESGVGDRERMLRDRRYLTLTPGVDGMTRLAGMLDPESAATVRAVFDAATSPRRGGPRFVDPDEKAAAERLVADERSLGQIALDTFVDLLRIGADADPNRLLGAARHAVRVLVTADDLASSSGVGFLAGESEPVSVSTVQRHICVGGILPIEFSTGGGTDVDDGVLLCRHHHLLIHDNGWLIELDDVHGFVAIPPPDIDPHRTPIPMPSKSPILARRRP